MGQAVLADCGALAGTITGIRGCIYDVLLDDGETALDLHWSTIYTVDGAKQGRLTYEDRETQLPRGTYYFLICHHVPF